MASARKGAARSRASGILAAAALAAAVPAGLPALTPDDAFWDSAVESMAAEPRLPEDVEMGPLADLRNPDSRWAAAVAVCETAFRAIRSGEVPEGVFLERMEPLLALEFERALSDGPLEANPRYGRPLREGGRVSVPLRLVGRDGPVYGHVYLVRTEEGEWRIDQWSVDLTGLDGADGAAAKAGAGGGEAGSE